jgi:hypothetical protein
MTPAACVWLMLTLAACSGSPSPGAPTPSPGGSPAGSWSGTIADPVSGEGVLQLTLDDGGQTLVGTWSATFRNGDRISGAAYAFAVPTGYGIMLSADPQPTCTATSSPALLGYTLINVAVTSNRLSATAGRTSCNGFGFGSLSLSKQ